MTNWIYLNNVCLIQHMEINVMHQNSKMKERKKDMIVSIEAAKDRTKSTLFHD